MFLSFSHFPFKDAAYELRRENFEGHLADKTNHTNNHWDDFSSDDDILDTPTSSTRRPRPMSINIPCNIPVSTRYR